MDMDCGKWEKKKMIRNIKDIIVWIRNLDMANILGLMDGFIKETLKMIIEKDMASYLIISSVFFKVSGTKEIK